MSKGYNKGEWSELYAFIKLLKEGRIYAANEYAERMDSYYPILKIIRSDIKKNQMDYMTGNPIKIYKNGALVGSVSVKELNDTGELLFKKIFEGSQGSNTFSVPEIDDFLNKIQVSSIKASSTEKVDILMQIHDIKTGYVQDAGFSIKSDVGSAPTLLNAGKNTRFRYEITGITDKDMHEINAIVKSPEHKEYMKDRIKELFKRSETVKYSSMDSAIYEGNLMLLDSMLPEIYGDFILYHYKLMGDKGLDCEGLCELMELVNPLGYKRKGIYRYKVRKLFCASALGMTPGKEWDGEEAATGGYIIIKKDGDVVCYHIYNRNFFEEYLLKNTAIDRPSATRHEYGFVFKDKGKYYIDLNIQIRFKSISAERKVKTELDDCQKRLLEYSRLIKSLK